METITIESRVQELIALMAGIPAATIDVEQSVSKYGIDSLALAVLRENVEERFHVRLPDAVWERFHSIRELAEHITDEVSAAEAGVGARRVHRLPRNGRRLTPSGLLYTDIEVGMPLTGLNNLAENPLLKALGHLRWIHLSALCGVESRQIVDGDGHRIYPTFFYVDLAFPPDRAMASFEENDRITIASTLTRFGGSMLDGVCFLLPPDVPEADEAPYDGVEAALAAGIPAVRLSNIFVRQYNGAEWLKKSRPATPGFERISHTAKPPDSYLVVKQAERDRCFSRPGPTYVSMTRGPVRTQYRLVADRDLNGAGLVYFANYPLFVDICERQVLAGAALPLSEELIDRRTIVRRRSAYLNNASSRDTLDIDMEAWIENPAATGHPSPEEAPIRLFVNATMVRQSDQRLMMVSTAQKVICGTSAKSLPFLATLIGR